MKSQKIETFFGKNIRKWRDRFEIVFSHGIKLDDSTMIVTFIPLSVGSQEIYFNLSIDRID